MKKWIALALALMLATAFCGSALAADPAKQEKTTEITTSIDPTYTVTIPGKTAVPFRATSTSFGEIRIAAAQIHPNKCIKVSLAASNQLKNSLDSAKVIPYTVKAGDTAFTSATYTKAGQKTDLAIVISEADWNRAYAGSYSDTMTFTFSYEDKSVS